MAINMNLLTLSEVVERVGMKPETIEEWSKAGNFPRSYSISGHGTVYREMDIDAFLKVAEELAIQTIFKDSVWGPENQASLISDDVVTMDGVGAMFGRTGKSVQQLLQRHGKPFCKHVGKRGARYLYLKSDVLVWNENNGRILSDTPRRKR